MIMTVSVGINIKHIAVANFHSGSFKKVCVVCYEEENAYLKDLKTGLPIFVIVLTLNGGMNHCCFLFRFLLFVLGLLLSCCL